MAGIEGEQPRLLSKSTLLGRGLLAGGVDYGLIGLRRLQLKGNWGLKIKGASQRSFNRGVLSSRVNSTHSVFLDVAIGRRSRIRPRFCGLSAFGKSAEFKWQIGCYKQDLFAK
ncbi:MAG: hypothetical protein ACI8X5_000352 [Planctomycetota bacterium]|jgi:hypothetical protein